MNNLILEIDELTAGYYDADILKKISFHLQERSFVGIIGPNGSGKSTLMQVLARSLPVRSGRVILLEDSIDRYSYRDFGKIVGFVPQENDIAFSYRVYDVVMMGRNPHISRFHSPSPDDHEAVTKALEHTGTMHLANRQVTLLSGGERQRVMIARILAQDPVLLLLDEPLAHIDLHHQYELIRIIRDTSREKRAVIGVFHDINLAAAYCDHLIVLDDGEIRAFGRPDEVLTFDLIHEIFRITPAIDVNPATGRPFVFVSDDQKPIQGAQKVIHLISGGGTGSCLIPSLVHVGYALRCGILSPNDSDCLMAERMNIPTLVEPPFSRISPDMEAKLREQVSLADVVVVTSMPVGWGNFPNIRVLEQVDPRKIVFFSPHPDPFLSDFTSGVASSVVSRLLDTGASRVSSLDALLAVIQDRDPGPAE